MTNILQHVPNFDLLSAEKILADRYNIQAKAARLPSERDQNFRMTAADGRQFVLKIANGNEHLPFLDAQQAYLQHVASAGINFCPQIIPTIQGEHRFEIASPNGTQHWVRLVTFLTGTPMGNASRQTADLMYDLGHKLGQLDAASVDFDHPAAHRTFHWDLAVGLDVTDRHRTLVTEPGQLEFIDHVLADFNRYAHPHLHDLRRSIIHSDANDFNVIVGQAAESDYYQKNQTVTGIIDFGDMVHSYTVGNLAIAAAYAILDKDDPLATAATMAAGYNAAHPLSDKELAALFGLINLRLAVSICMAAVQLQERPDDEYLAISQQPIRNTIPHLAKIAYPLATAVFRHACGLDPIPHSPKVVEWLKKQAPFPILGRDLAHEETLTLDLSISSPMIHGDSTRNAEPALTARIFQAMADAGVDVSIGRYNEPRLIYTAEMFQASQEYLAERRTIHVGMDLFAVAGTPIYAPLDGRVAACGVHNNPDDYGGVIVLEHQTDDGDVFYTLYGHLMNDSARHVTVGQSIAAGQQLAHLGPPNENGGWPPHLHLQIVTDMLGLDESFAGVGEPSRRDVWRSISPDPNLLVRLPADRLPSADDIYDETLHSRKTKLGRNLSLGYRNHLKIARGWRQYLWDHQGDRYLDGYNNVPHVGHCHPHVVEAGRQQMGVLNTNTRYLHDLINQYAERLTATMPDPLSVCYFVNSASEANELALRLARAYTGHKNLIVNEGAYHGHTTGLIDISPYKHDGPGGQGAPDWVHTAPIADVYRGRYKADDPQAAAKYAAEVQSIIGKLDGLSGFIAETCPSVGGQIMLPEGYLAAVYAYVKAAGGINIADEVQTGYGRIGTHFYAFQAHDVVPDIVVLGKPIGNGHPIGALVTTPEIADAFNNGMEFFSTFGGNNVSCAVGLAVLDVLEQEQLQENALKVGAYMLDRMRIMRSKHEIIGDVRGSGFFLGMEFVRDRETLQPAAPETSFVSNELRRHKILVGTDGPLHNVLKIRPPMPFNMHDAEFAMDTLDNILRSL